MPPPLAEKEQAARQWYIAASLLLQRVCPDVCCAHLVGRVLSWLTSRYTSLGARSPGHGKGQAKSLFGEAWGAQRAALWDARSPQRPCRGMLHVVVVVKVVWGQRRLQDMWRCGCTLAEILGAGQWKSSAFTRYIDEVWLLVVAWLRGKPCVAGESRHRLSLCGRDRVGG